MSEPQLDVKIVKLEPMRVACVNGYGSQPEDLAFQKMRAFVQAHGLDGDGQTHRFSWRYSPGATKSHTCRRITGLARKIPAMSAMFR